MPSKPDPEAEALVRAYVSRSSHVGTAAVEIARDLIDSMAETDAAVRRAEIAEAALSRGYARRRP